MNSAEYLDLAIKKAEVKNDNQLAIKLGWSRAKISNYRNLKQAMDNEAALELSEFMDIPVLKIIADMEVQRGKSSNKNTWVRLAKMTQQMGSASAMLLIPLSILAAYVQQCILCKITKISENADFVS